VSGGGVVQVFARAPRPGACKTRLIPALGERRAALLQRWMIGRALATAAAAAIGPLELWRAPGLGADCLAGLARAHRARLRVQRGADLGARMAHALEAGVRARGAALLIGSDCPALEPVDLRRAAAALIAGAEAVLIPAEDGGFVLLGVRRMPEALLQGVPWGEAVVLERTRARLRERGWRWRELAARADLDRPEDLPGLGPIWFAGRERGPG